MKELVMYGRTGCHLCDDMAVALAEYEVELDFCWRIEDVDRQPEWIEKYGSRVPVLMCADTEICHYFLDLDALRRCL